MDAISVHYNSRNHVQQAFSTGSCYALQGWIVGRSGRREVLRRFRGGHAERRTSSGSLTDREDVSQSGGGVCAGVIVS
jgi:hypothetical protein